MRRLAFLCATLLATAGSAQTPMTRYVQPSMGYFTQSVSVGKNAVWRQADGAWLVKFVEQQGGGPDVTTFEGLLSLDTLLNIQWARRFALNGEGSQVVIGDVKPLDDGGYLVATAVNDTTLQLQYSVVERYDAANALVWQRTLRTDNCGPHPFDLHAPQGVLVIGDHFYVGHRACSSSNGSVVPNLTKLDTLGNLMWTKQYDAGASGGVTTTWVAVPGGIALCGNRSFVTLIDTSGAVQWSAGPWGNFFPERAIPALDGGVVVLCSRFAGSSDLVLAKVTSAGDTAWVREMVSNEPPQGLALREDTDGTVHVLSRANLVTHETYFDANGNITAGSSWEGEAGRYCWAAGPWNDGWLMVFRQNNFTDYQISRHVQGSTTPCLEEAPAVALSAVIPPTSAAAPSFIGAPTLLPVSTAMAALPVSFVQQLCTSTDTGDPRPGTSYPMAWPVPADAELCLRAPGWEAGGRCVILDHAGRVVWGGFLSSGGTIRVDTANWSSGTYCAIVADDAHVEHVPVMVVH